MLADCELDDGGIVAGDEVAIPFGVEVVEVLGVIDWDEITNPGEVAIVGALASVVGA